MKKNLLTLICILTTSCIYAQKIEVSLQANAGSFRYSGASTSNTAFISQSQSNNENNFISNPYGNSNTFSYGFGAQSQLVFKNSFIIGLQAGYDVLRSKNTINQVYPYANFASLIPSSSSIAASYVGPVAATGESTFQTQAINISPYLGYRLSLNAVKLDILPGFDIGFNVDNRDKGTATIADGTVYPSDYKRPKLPTDVRLKLGLALSYNKFIVNASFAHGLTNYQKTTPNLTPGDVHSELFRLGIGYRIY